jgi:hypothetical protein
MSGLTDTTMKACAAEMSPAMPRTEPFTIYCYAEPPSAPDIALVELLDENRLLTYQAMLLFLTLNRELLEARADWKQDRFRRLMRARSRAVTRLQRRWARINPPPRIPLGSLRRRYQPNLAGGLRTGV